MRTLLVVVTAIGVFAAREARTVSVRRTLRQQIVEGGGNIDGEGRGQQTCLSMGLYSRNISALGRASAVPFWREWLGDRDVDLIIMPPSSTDDDCRIVLAAFPEISNLDLYAGATRTAPVSMTPPPPALPR